MSVWFFLSCVLPPKDFYPTKQSSVEAEHFQKGLDVDKRVGIMLLEESPFVFFIRFGKWKLTRITPWRSTILFYAILLLIAKSAGSNN